MKQTIMGGLVCFFMVLSILEVIRQAESEVLVSRGVVMIGNNIHGNYVGKRRVYLKTAYTRMAFLDYETSLPEGQLKRFFIYIHNCSNTQDETSSAQYCDPTGKENVTISLQIWRPIDIQSFKYTLVWSTDVQVNFTSPNGFLLTYIHPDTDPFNTKEGDRIGWANSKKFGPISFNYSEGHRTYFVGLQLNILPVVGRDYMFDNVHLPATFSVAVDIGFCDAIISTNFTREDINIATALAITRVGGESPRTDVFGNTVTRRAVFLKTGSRKTFLDSGTALPRGRLMKYFAYIHNCSNTQVQMTDAQYCDPTGKENVTIALQIWRPISIQLYRYYLVWSTDIRVSFTSDTGFSITYALPETELVFTRDGDRIGWTNPQNFGVVSFGYSEGHMTQFLNLQPNQLPVVGREYIFDNIHLPAIFSVAVEISTSDATSTTIHSTTSPKATTPRPVATTPAATTPVEKTPTATNPKSLMTTSSSAMQASVGVEHPRTDVFGNEITSGAVFIKTGSRKTFLDSGTALPRGRLMKYLAYIHNCSNTHVQMTDAQYCDPTGKENVTIALQIWRPISIQLYKYYLAWSTDIQVNFTSKTGFPITYVVPETESVFTRDGDRIGWTNPQNFGVVSFSYSEGHMTHTLNLQPNQLPVVGREYVFDNIHLPFIFSVAVEISTSVTASTKVHSTASSKPTNPVPTTPAASNPAATNPAATTPKSRTVTTSTSTAKGQVNHGNSGMIIGIGFAAIFLIVIIIAAVVIS